MSRKPTDRLTATEVLRIVNPSGNQLGRREGPDDEATRRAMAEARAILFNSPKRVRAEDIAALFNHPVVRARLLEGFTVADGTFATAAREATRLVGYCCDDTPGGDALRHAAAMGVSGVDQADDATAELRRELRARAPEVRAKLATEIPPSEPPIEGGILAWDERFAAYLEDIGSEGKRVANQVREGGAKRLAGYQEGELGPVELMARWFPEGPDSPAPKFLVTLATVLWRDRVEALVARIRMRPAAATTRSTLGHLVSTHYGSGLLPRAQMLGASVQRLPDGSEVESIDVDHRDKLAKRLKVTGPVTDSALLDALTEKARATRSMTGQLLLRHLFEVGYRQKSEGRYDFRNYLVQGGLAELCKLLGRPDCGDERSLLHDALDGYELIRIPISSGGFDGLLRWSDRKAAPGRKAEVQIVMMDPMLPGYVHSLPVHTHSQKENRVLIPVPTRIPPLTGNRVTYGSKLLLQMLTLESLAMGWRDYATQGVRLTRQTWNTMADRVELERNEAIEARQAFVAGTEDAPPFLVELPDQRFKLAPAYQDAERVLLEGAEERIGKSNAYRQKLSPNARPRRGLTPAQHPTCPTSDRKGGGA